MRFQLEVIAFNPESCTTIRDSGAHRVELCSNPHEGGTTPSQGFIRLARERLPVELFPIIRPRGGDFCYSDDEYQVMRADVAVCKQLGCDGVVLGLLHPDGRIDLERTCRLVELAYPMDVTFHRAFDRVKDPMQALEDVIASGCTRILTSGLRAAAHEGRELLRELVRQADERIGIMPGSGIRAANIKEIALFTGAREFHTSARIRKRSGAFVNPWMHDDPGYEVADAAEIAGCLRELHAAESGGPSPAA
ncbi:MAG TPA: copper homeostasis protein CutC [Sphingobacteriaceae bacterium]